MPRIQTLLFILITSFIVAGCSRQASPNPTEPQACTEDARMCDDGSAVVRIGPNCEFAPCPTPTASDTPDPEANIKVSEPIANQLLTFPMTVKGEARVFENVLSVALLDDKGQVFSETVTTANSPDTGQFGTFSATFKTKPASKTGFVKVFSHSAKDGSEINVVTIPVRFQ